jgi:hypothetical protein
MTNGQATAIGERVAVLEHKIDATSEAVKAISDKLDMLIAGQADNKRELADMRAAVENMKPDVATISDIKRAGKMGAWLIGGMASIAAALAAGKGWIVLNWQWLTGRL